VAALLTRHRVHALVVSENDGSPLVIISSFDIVAEMTRPGSIWQI